MRRQVGTAKLWLALAVGLLAGCATTPRTQVSLANVPTAQVARAAENLRVFHAVWDLVNRKHFDPELQGVDWEAAAAACAPRIVAAKDDRELYDVLAEMVGLLKDSHTRVLTPIEAEERRTERRVRTGFSMVRVEGRWLVNEVLPDTPAEAAGVKPGWIVLARNGEPLGSRIDFRPREGEEAVWDFLDEKDRQVSLAPRATRLSIASRQLARKLEDGFVYLRFDAFDGPDRRWLARQLDAHKDAPGLVIDLRRNSGGDTFSLGIVIGHFFDRRVSCGTFVSRAGHRDVKNSWQFGSASYGGPVVVLIDAGTASAAEIFTAVLQDHGRAAVVGRRSAGAVLASWFYRLPGGGELQLSREDYIAPKGRRIEGNGVEPDITTPRTLADIRGGRDRDLETALEILRGKVRPTTEPESGDRKVTRARTVETVVSGLAP